MSTYVPDPDIDRLVHETNRLADGDAPDDDYAHAPQPAELDGVALRVVAVEEDWPRCSARWRAFVPAT